MTSRVRMGMDRTEALAHLRDHYGVPEWYAVTLVNRVEREAAHEMTLQFAQGGPVAKIAQWDDGSFEVIDLRRREGECPACRGDYPLDASGRLTVHKRLTDPLATIVTGFRNRPTARCEGSGRKPR